MIRLIACVVVFLLAVYSSAIAAPKFVGQFTVDQANCSIEDLKDATFASMTPGKRTGDGSSVLRITPVGGQGKSITLLMGSGTRIEPGFEDHARNQLREIWNNVLEGNTLTNRRTYARPRVFSAITTTTVLIDHGSVIEIRISSKNASRPGRSGTASCRLRRR